MELESIIKISGAVTTIVVLIVGIYQYTRTQLWKRQEFISGQVTEFQNNLMVKNVMQILDWGSREIELFPEKDLPNRKVFVNRTILNASLEDHTKRPTPLQNKARFNETEIAIRDNIDAFLTYLEKFNQFLKVGLFKEKELKPFILYWMDTINTHLNPETKHVLFNYMSVYRYAGAKEFILRFNKT